MKVLIDTNVILDAMIHREPFHEAAEEIFLLAAERKIAAFLTANSVTDIYYLFRKHSQDASLAKQSISKLLTLFEILDVSGLDCEQALELPMKDYEDAIVTACARRHRMDRIVTRNTKDFLTSSVVAILPCDFLNGLKDEE